MLINKYTEHMLMLLKAKNHKLDMSFEYKYNKIWIKKRLTGKISFIMVKMKVCFKSSGEN